jgi:hypothetical protein
LIPDYNDNLLDFMTITGG